MIKLKYEIFILSFKYFLSPSQIFIHLRVKMLYGVKTELEICFVFLFVKDMFIGQNSVENLRASSLLFVVSLAAKIIPEG